MIKSEVFTFLRSLAKNNQREWFHDHKNDYANARQCIIELTASVEHKLNSMDQIEMSKLFRINRDVRFSQDKSPYKSNFSGYFKRLGEQRRGSYYFSIEPDNTVIGGGFYGPNKADLYRIRKEFEVDSSIQSIVDNKVFKNYFGTLLGEGVSTAPRGFDKNHPNIHWIRKKQWYAFRKFTDEEVIQDNFVEEVIKTYAGLRPFFDYMSEVLTTDLNGESILKGNA